jgi:hypothetical protein
MKDHAALNAAKVRFARHDAARAEAKAAKDEAYASLVQASSDFSKALEIWAEVDDADFAALAEARAVLDEAISRRARASVAWRVACEASMQLAFVSADESADLVSLVLAERDVLKTNLEANADAPPSESDAAGRTAEFTIRTGQG